MKKICLLILVVFLPVMAVLAQEKQGDKTTASKADPYKEKISLDLKNVEIIELIRLLSLKTGKTIVPSKDITGRITLFLNNISFQDILDILVLSQGLACEKKGEIIFIMTNAEYKNLYGKDYIESRKMLSVRLAYAKPANVFNALSQLKSDIGKIIVDEATGTVIIIDIPDKLELLQKTIKEIDQPLETAVYDLNYVKPADAKTQLTAALTQGTGEVIIDERSGKAIVSDLPKKMEKIKNIVKEIDEETRQVFIEGEIIQVTISDNFNRGISWERVFQEAKMHGLDFVGTFPVSPALSAFQKISVGTLATDNFNAVINLLNTYGDTEVLSQPRIAVVNNEESNLMVGSREAYITQTLSQGDTSTVTSEQVEFIDVGIKLKVVPTINKDGFITMKIKPEVSSIKETITTSLGSRVPVVQTAETETVIKVKDGTMIMLGGLLERRDEDVTAGLPKISRWPWIGALFGTREKEKKRTELVIFITPHIIRGDSIQKNSEPEKFLSNQILADNLKKGIVERKLKEVEAGLEDKDLTLKQTAALQQDSDKKKIEQKDSASDSAVVKVSDSKKKKPFNDKVLYRSKKSLFADQIIDYYKRGLEFQRIGNYSEAASFFQKIIIVDDSYVPAYNQLGIIYEIKGWLDRAEEAYLKALEIDPEYPPTYSNLALLKENQKDYKSAVQYWKKRMSYGSTNDHWVKIAQKHLELIQNKLQEQEER